MTPRQTRQLLIFSMVGWALVTAFLPCRPTFAQHDVHRNAARMLARGKGAIEKAVLQLKNKADDPESLFLLMAASCLEKDPPQALDYAKKAVQAGLPLERILAGPRDVLAPLYGLEEFKAWAKKQPSQLLHGPLVGCLTDGSARFWVRTAGKSMVTVEVEPANGPKAAPIRSTTVQSDPARDFTAVVEVRGLSANTAYRYRLLVDGEQIGKPASLRTYPQAHSQARFRVGFGGGAGFVPKRERMWDTIAAQRLAAFLMLGDNVYIDDPQHDLTQRYCYYRRQSRPEWRRLTASTNIYAIYDDHGFGTNDCVPGPRIEQPTWKRQVWNVFRQNWNNPAYGGGERQPGSWFDFYIGDVHFILIDGRYYRDLKGGSMLGPAQKAWLLKTLENSRGAFKVLASNVPWTPGVKPGSRDTWDGFPGEREEIFSFIEQHKINGVVLIAADRHRSDIRRIERPKGYDLYEFQSSRLTNNHTHGIVKTPGLLFGYNKDCSFGLLEFDTQQPDPQVRFVIVNIDGKRIYAMELKRSQLSHARKD